ncbi:hypothetical protein ACWV27_27025 (plasmid) [Massilia varians]
MKLIALTPEMEQQLAALLNTPLSSPAGAPAPALEQLRAAVNGAGFVPKVYVGLEGGMVQGATANIGVQVVLGDYDLEGADEDEQVRRLTAFNTDAIIRQPHVIVNPAILDALLVDALSEESTPIEAPVEGMHQ